MQFRGRGAMPRATKAWSAESNLRRLFGGRAALRRAYGEAGEASTSGLSERRGGDETGAERSNSGRVARPPTADEDTDYETASEGDAEAMVEALLSVQASDADARDDDDAWIRAGASDRLSREEVPSTSRRASFDASLPRASAFVAQEAPDASAAHWSGNVEIMDWLKVRGPAYRRTRRKQTSAVPVMECVKVDLFTFEDAPCDDVANARPESWLNGQRRAWRGRERDTNGTAEGAPLVVPPHRRPWTFAFQFQNPGPPFVSIAAYFQPTGSRAGMCLDALLAHERETPFGRTLERFLAADDATRDGKLKMVCALLDAPWALRTAVPRRPIILGKKLGRGGGLKYHRGDDYFEVDFELARSPFMERVYRSLKWASPCAEEEIVFMLEGQAEDELPECVLGAVRLKRVGESSFRKLPPMAVGAGKKSLHFDRFNFARDDPARRRRVSSPTGGGGG